MSGQIRTDFPESHSLDLSDRLSGLRVALVHDWLTGRRGGEKCLEFLCEAFPDARLFTLLHRSGSVGPVIERLKIQTSPLQRVPGIEHRYRSLLPLMPLAARSWKVQDVDLVVSFSHCVAKAVRLPEGVPHVCYCFTPMRYAWEGRKAYLDSWTHKPIRRTLAGWALDRLQDWDRGTADRVTHFIAISQTVQRRIQASYGRESQVLQPPVDTAFYSPAPVDRESFYLVVSALVPYKRIDHAIQACQAAGKRLIIIGEGPDRARLESLAGAETQFLGWQSDHTIRDHFRRCRALLFPGVEDFGIVPMEALACGAPVIALDDGGVAETVDHSVGWLYQEPTPQGLRHAIEAWESEGAPHDPVLGRNKAELFSGSRFRTRLLTSLADIVDEHKESKRPVSAIAPGPHRHPHASRTRAKR